MAKADDQDEQMQLHVERLISTLAPAFVGEHLSCSSMYCVIRATCMAAFHCNFVECEEQLNSSVWLGLSFLLPPQFDFDATVTAVECCTSVPTQPLVLRKKKEIADSEKELNTYRYIPEPSMNRATTQSKGSQHCVCQAVSCSVSACWSVLSSLVPLDLCS